MRGIGIRGAGMLPLSMQGGGQGAAAWIPDFLFLDKFTTLDAAPLTSPRACEPGPGEWTTIADTGTTLNISGGALSHTATATNDPRLFGTSVMTREVGLGFFASIYHTDTNGQYFQMVNAANTAIYAMRIAGVVAISTPNAGNAVLVSPTAYNYYKAGYVLRGTGAYYIFNGNLVWVDNTSSVDLKPGMAARAGGAGAHIDRVAAAVMPGAFKDGDYGLATFRVAVPANGETQTGIADGLTEFTWTPGAAETLTLMVRRTDDDNCWKVVCDQAGSRIYLYERQAGGDTERGAAGGVAQTWTVGTAYRIVVEHVTQTINVHVANTSKVSYAVAAFNQAVTGVKVSGFATGANLVAWPRALPAALVGYINQLFATPINASAALTTPTYEASGEAVHPSVVYVAAGWNNYKYWMAMTPYPSGDSTVENPSIIVSNDGTTWIEPPGIVNPISGVLGAGEFYSDPELILSQDQLTMWCIYRWSDGVANGKLIIRSSADGVTWSAPADLIVGTNLNLVSPSIAWDGAQYVMWLNDSTGGSPNAIVKRTCATINGVWSAAGATTFTNRRAYADMWHIAVTLVAGTYYMFMGLSQPGGSTNADIFLATSADGDAWTFDPEIVLGRGVTGAWDANRQHRAFPRYTSGTTFDLFYSARSVAGNWHIGRTTYTR